MKQITDFVRGLALGVALGILLSSAPPARAEGVKIELGTGLTVWGQRGDGNWYQRDYGPYDLDTRSPNLSLGLTGDVFGLRWRAGAQYLGRYSTRCVCLSSDIRYQALQRGEGDGGWPPSHYYTRGSGYGIYATILPEWHIGRGWFFQVEIGLGYYGVSNKVHVPDWYYTVNAEQTQWGGPVDLNVDNGRKWRLTPVYGFGLARGDTSVAVTARHLNLDGPWYPIVSETAWTVEVRHGF